MNLGNLETYFVLHAPMSMIWLGLEVLKLYTRTGDEGETFCMRVKGKVKKYDLIIEFMGTLDEANSALGLASGFAEGNYKEEILNIQRTIFNIGFEIAGSAKLNGSEIADIEKKIDMLTDNISLSGFILPGGCPLCGALHLARSVLRRSERLFWKLVDTGGLPRDDRVLYIGKLLNRLSDLLFALALRVSIDRHTVEYV